MWTHPSVCGHFLGTLRVISVEEIQHAILGSPNMTSWLFFIFTYTLWLRKSLKQSCQWENDAAVITAAAVSRPCQLCGSLGAWCYIPIMMCNTDCTDTKGAGGHGEKSLMCWWKCLRGFPDSVKNCLPGGRIDVQVFTTLKVALDLIYYLRRAGRPMHVSTGMLKEILQVGFAWAQSAILTAGIEIVWLYVLTALCSMSKR